MLDAAKWDADLDFPTCVGMARYADANFLALAGFPHLRGDGPVLRSDQIGAASISPPAWGWPADPLGPLDFSSDFPTCVGMARI